MKVKYSHLEKNKTSNERELQLNSELMTLLFSRIFLISRITLASHKEFKKVCDKTDTLTLFNIINETHRTGSSITHKTAITQLRKYITCSMSNRSHQIYMHEFKELEATTRANFADKDDNISVSTLSAAIYIYISIYISGLDQELFEYKIEKFFEQYPDRYTVDTF